MKYKNINVCKENSFQSKCFEQKKSDYVHHDIKYLSNNKLRYELIEKCGYKYIDIKIFSNHDLKKSLAKIVKNTYLQQ